MLLNLNGNNVSESVVMSLKCKCSKMSFSDHYAWLSSANVVKLTITSITPHEIMMFLQGLGINWCKQTI